MALVPAYRLTFVGTLIEMSFWDKLRQVMIEFRVRAAVHWYALDPIHATNSTSFKESLSVVGNELHLRIFNGTDAHGDSHPDVDLVITRFKRPRQKKLLRQAK